MLCVWFTFANSILESVLAAFKCIRATATQHALPLPTVCYGLLLLGMNSSWFWPWPQANVWGMHTFESGCLAGMGPFVCVSWHMTQVSQFFQEARNGCHCSLFGCLSGSHLSRVKSPILCALWRGDVRMDKPSSEHCSKLFRYLLLAGVAEIIQYLQGSNHGSAIPFRRPCRLLPVVDRPQQLEDWIWLTRSRTSLDLSLSPLQPLPRHGALTMLASMRKPKVSWILRQFALHLMSQTASCQTPPCTSTCPLASEVCRPTTVTMAQQMWRSFRSVLANPSWQCHHRWPPVKRCTIHGICAIT